MPICSVGTEGMRKWKKNCRQERRAKEKAQMNGITQDEEGYDEETCTPVKYQKDKNMSDWSGTHDGYWRGEPKEIAEDMYDGDEENLDVLFQAANQCMASLVD